MSELEYAEEPTFEFFERIVDESRDPHLRVREPSELFDRYYRPKPAPLCLEGPQAA